MKTIRIMITADHSKKPLWFSLPRYSFRIVLAVVPVFSLIFAYILYDYSKLSQQKKSFQTLVKENSNLKSEAQILLKNVYEVNKKLDQVRDMTRQANDLLALKVKRIEKKTGLVNHTDSKQQEDTASTQNHSNQYVPLGVNLESLSFGEAIKDLRALEKRAQAQTIELRQLLSNLTQHAALLASTPTVAPVSGWITSRYGVRISPFTGQKTFHRGVDIAGRVGTPIFAPADGVVIFSGEKSPFGNFIMIAHFEHGIVSRYGHNNENLVKTGQQVFRGEQIATLGASGKVTGPHLHYEILVNGQFVDPMQFMLNSSLNSLNSF